MKKLTKDEQRVCRDLDLEIGHVTREILDLWSQINNLQGELQDLKEEKESLFCPEDTSPEAIAQNKKLLKILNQENYGRGDTIQTPDTN